jgi:hypothetical protein
MMIGFLFTAADSGIGSIQNGLFIKFLKIDTGKSARFTGMAKRVRGCDQPWGEKEVRSERRREA